MRSLTISLLIILAAAAAFAQQPTFGERVEVDVVIELGARAIAGVEVKASATVVDADFRGLHKLKQAAGRAFAAGIVLYDGEMSTSFGDRLFAVPIRFLWEPSI